jgi:hypothetical protein
MICWKTYDVEQLRADVIADICVHVLSSKHALKKLPTGLQMIQKILPWSWLRGRLHFGT